MHRIAKSILNAARWSEVTELKTSLQGGSQPPLLGEDPELTVEELESAAEAAVSAYTASTRNAAAQCQAIFRLALLRDIKYAALRDGPLRRHGLQSLFQEYYAGCNNTKTLPSA